MSTKAIDLQQEFESKYITSGQICEAYNVTVFTLNYMRNAGKLPGAVKVANMFIFDRAAVTPALEQYVAERAGKAAYPGVGSK